MTSHLIMVLWAAFFVFAAFTVGRFYPVQSKLQEERERERRRLAETYAGKWTCVEIIIDKYGGHMGSYDTYWAVLERKKGKERMQFCLAYEPSFHPGDTVSVRFRSGTEDERAWVFFAPFGDLLIPVPA